jgi:microcystin-dependent protein
MSTPYLSEIKIVSFNFAPKGWALCNGQLLPINQNQALFSLMGTTYGGDGRVNFALPNLQSRIALHMGSNFTIGQVGGEESHTLTQPEMPAHTHLPFGAVSIAADKGSAVSSVPAVSAPNQVYSAGGSGMLAVAMSPAMVTNAGGSLAHENRMPYTVLNFIIALQGIFPSQN